MKNIVIAGGGTGGHIYPGVAIARSLEDRSNKEIKIHFVGAYGGLEERILPQEGFDLHLLKVGKLNHSGGLWSKTKTLFFLPVAFCKSIYLICILKPVAVLGVGGYASGPFVLMASLLGRRTFLWEPNAFPGLTNRILSFFVRRSFVVFDKAAEYLKTRRVERVGLPVRREIELVSKMKDKVMEENKALKILVFGGSQGATIINEVVYEVCSELALKNIEVSLIHQTGQRNFVKMKAVYAEKFSFVNVRSYLHDMSECLEWADLVICRGGASTMAELMAAGRPAVIIPLPTAADDHQRKNAQELVNQQAAEMILQKDLTGKILVEKIEFFVQNPSLLKKMGESAREMYIPEAALKIADKLLNQ